jgi:hypothetical protein
MQAQPNVDMQPNSDGQANPQLSISEWIKLGLLTALASVAAVLLVQYLAILVWPEIGLFKPLDSYPRSALFTAIPVVGATGLLAWLVARRPQPVRTFITIALLFLALSIVPDYLLPVPHRTMLASSVTALLHGVAGAVTVWMLVTGYQQRARLIRPQRYPEQAIIGH